MQEYTCRICKRKNQINKALPGTPGNVLKCPKCGDIFLYQERGDCKEGYFLGKSYLNFSDKFFDTLVISYSPKYMDREIIRSSIENLNCRYKTLGFNKEDDFRIPENMSGDFYYTDIVPLVIYIGIMEIMRKSFSEKKIISAYEMPLFNLIFKKNYTILNYDSIHDRQLISQNKKILIGVRNG